MLNFDLSPIIRFFDEMATDFHSGNYVDAALRGGVVLGAACLTALEVKEMQQRRLTAGREME